MKVSVIIPAYNEANTIGNIVSLLKNISEIDEVIVVSDGSVDLTTQIAIKCGARVIELQKNVGKGGAMKIGVDSCNADIVLFLDADLIGLRQEHVKSILFPVLNGEVEMSVGVFEGGRFSTDLAQKISPFLSGQRAVKKDLLNNVEKMETSKFGVEAAITGYVKKNKLQYKTVTLDRVTHVMKEEKMGFKNGVRARMGMYKDVVKYIAANKFIKH